MVINQPFGIGDILFIEPILRHFWMKNGEKPILPVRDHLMWLSEYIDSARFVKMSEFKLDYDSMDMSNPDYLPLRFANQIYRGYGPNDHHDFENMMLDKYRLCGLEEYLWKTAHLKLNNDKADKLYNQLNPKGKEYILVNKYCGIGKIDINIKTDLLVIEMQEIKGYTMIDWWLLMSNALENHHVSTSTFFILQEMFRVLEFQYSQIFIYPRPNEDGLRGISQLKPSFEYKIGKL